MNIQILKQETHLLEIEIDNLTIAEILRGRRQEDEVIISALVDDFIEYFKTENPLFSADKFLKATL